MLILNFISPNTVSQVLKHKGTYFLQSPGTNTEADSYALFILLITVSPNTSTELESCFRKERCKWLTPKPSSQHT